jgi:iron complex transport system substrate-binding protein
VNRNDSYKIVKMIAVCLIGLLMIFVAAGCNKTTSKNEPVGQAGSYPLQITDSIGRQVTIPSQPQRIVSLAPSNTENLYFLGLGDRLVGDTSYCDYPEEAKKVAKVGGFKDPSLEKVIALQPDLVLATDIHQSMLASMEGAGLKVVVINPETIDETFESMILIGKSAGIEGQARTLVTGLKDRVSAVSSKAANIPENQRPTVYYEIWNQPLMTIGKDSLISQIITLAGGINVTGDMSEPYPQISEEIIIARNPQVMINSYGMNSQLLTPEEIGARKGWQNVSFVKNKRIYTIESDLLTLAGPRIVNGIEQVYTCLYPQK